jgi:septal ring factor EnvC (AmiA/AmiB activator)
MIGLLLVLTALGAAGLAQTRATLTDEEAEQLRDAQDPSQRVEVYVALAQSRLDQFAAFRERTHDPKYDNGGYLDKLLGQYIAIDDEMKDWIDLQYQRGGDLRKGLRVLLDQGPQQLTVLRHIQETPDSLAPDYRDSLRDAMDDLSDALDGATKALAQQEKTFAAEKREEKVQAQEVKESAKDAKKRQKEERKLRKREHEHGVPEDPDQN